MIATPSSVTSKITARNSIAVYLSGPVPDAVPKLLRRIDFGPRPISAACAFELRTQSVRATRMAPEIEVRIFAILLDHSKSRLHALGLLVGQLCSFVSGVSGTNGRRRHKAASRLRAVAGRRHTCGEAKRCREQAGSLVATVQGARCPHLEPWSPNEAGVRCLRQNSSIIVSKVQVSPRWLQKTFSISNGTPPKRSATSTTSDGATNKNAACGSTKRRMSQGQAMRSIFGRARSPKLFFPEHQRRQLGEWNQRKLLLLPSFKSPSSTSAGTP